jgi:hypothetical protein
MRIATLTQYSRSSSSVIAVGAFAKEPIEEDTPKAAPAFKKARRPMRPDGLSIIEAPYGSVRERIFRAALNVLPITNGNSLAKLNFDTRTIFMVARLCQEKTSYQAIY